MKVNSGILVTSLLALAKAAPVEILNPYTELTVRDGDVNHIETRQTVSTTANEFLNGGCRDVIFIFARGTGQPGNMGDMPGPQTANALKSALGSAKVAAQGVSYSASLLGNLAAGGAPASEASSMRALITQAATQCPSAKIVVSGYSQGAALVHRAVEGATTAVKARIFAAVTYGDTQKAQDNGRIPNFDTSKTLIICNTGDRVCEGTLIITSAHSDYTGSVSTAISFIRSKLG